MKYVLQQIKEAKRMLENADEVLSDEVKKAIGGKYLVSIHYHYERPVISVWHDDDKLNNAPSYTLYDDHFEILKNGDYIREVARAAIQKILYSNDTDAAKEDAE